MLLFSLYTKFLKFVETSIDIWYPLVRTVVRRPHQKLCVCDEISKRTKSNINFVSSGERKRISPNR